MYQDREIAVLAMDDVRNVAERRIELLTGLGAHVRVMESMGTEPAIKLDVLFDPDMGWTEFIESSYTRGAPAFDREYVDALLSCGWTVLHYPAALVNEQFSAVKTGDLLDRAMDEGVDHPEVWVYLYDRDGSERRVQ